MKRLFSVLVVVATLLFAPLAFAGTNVTFEWDPNDPTENITGYRLYQSTTSGGHVLGTGEGNNCVGLIPAGTETITVPDIPDGTYFWVLTAYRVEGKDLDGNDIILWSLPSNEVTDTLDSTSLSAPGNLKITIKVIVEVEQP